MVALLLSPCAGGARFYNLPTGQITDLHCADNGIGHGAGNGRLAGGKPVSGGYSILERGGAPFITLAAHGPVLHGYGWATAEGFSFNQSDTGSGTAEPIRPRYHL